MIPMLHDLRAAFFLVIALAMLLFMWALAGLGTVRPTVEGEAYYVRVP